MKRIFITILSFFVFQSAYCQINHIELLVDKDDSYVIKYFDSLNSLKSNPYYKIKRSVSVYGDAILTVEFALNDESYYTCLSITCIFARVKGFEICFKQYITGREEFAKSNLDFVKDNFTFVPKNSNWEKVLVANRLKVTASFEKRESSYTIHYEVGLIK